MLLLILGLVLFIAVHAVPMGPALRGELVQRFGDNAYKIGFSVVSIASFALIVYGYHKLQMAPGKNPQIWNPPVWTSHITLLLMLPAMVLLVAAYIPSRIRDAAKHPMLLAVKIWALAHLLANGDLGSMILFAAFLAWAVADRISLKRRTDRGPLGNAQGGLAGDLSVVAVGAALYVGMVLWGHKWLIGVSVVPT